MIRRIITHCIFWIASALFLSFFIGKGLESYNGVLIFVALLLPIAVGTSYIFNYYLLPRYLFRQEYFRFGLYGFFTVVLSFYLQSLVILGSFIFLAEYELKNMIPGTMNVVNLGVGLYMVVFLSIVIFLIKRWTGPEEEKEMYLSFRSNREMVRLAVEDVLYIESLDNYVQVHSSEKVYITKKKISELEEELKGSFLRVHRSYLVNKSRIESYNRESLKINGSELPVSRTYKDQVYSSLNPNK